MTTLASPVDVEDSLGRSLTSDEGARATVLLELASAEVLRVTGYRFLPGSYTIGRRPGVRVILPGAVATVDEVRSINQVDGTETTWVLGRDYTTRGRTVYVLSASDFLEIDFTVTAPIPTVVTRVVAGIAASTIASPPVGTASETAGPFQVSYVNSQGKVWLSASDKSILKPYTQPRPALDLL
jgi:hypothetical protein